MCLHGFLVGGIFAHAEDAAMHLGMQRLHPAIQHFRKLRVFRYVLHGDTGVAERAGGAAGGENFHTVLVKKFSEFNQPGLVRYGKQGTGNRA